jgi:hypothetical protein
MFIVLYKFMQVLNQPAADFDLDSTPAQQALKKALFRSLMV